MRQATIRTKDDIKTHADGYRESNPAINVKVYNPGWDSSTVQTEFGCNEKTAERAAGWAWESAVEGFWDSIAEDVKENPEYNFKGHQVTIDSEGRMGGWLVVYGLPPLEEWGAVLLSLWKRFYKNVMAEVEYHSSWEYAKELIEANNWAVDDVTCPCCGSVVAPDRLRV